MARVRWDIGRISRVWDTRRCSVTASPRVVPDAGQSGAAEVVDGFRLTRRYRGQRTVLHGGRFTPEFRQPPRWSPLLFQFVPFAQRVHRCRLQRALRADQILDRPRFERGPVSKHLAISARRG